MRGLTFFGKTNVWRHRVIAWHSPHSLTWRWSLWVGLERPRLLPHFAPLRKLGRPGHKGLLEWTAHVFGLRLSFNQQEPMWYRDIYQHQRDRIEQLDGTLWKNEDQPNRVEPMKPVAWMRRASQASADWLAGIPEVRVGTERPGDDWTPLYLKPDLRG